MGTTGIRGLDLAGRKTLGDNGAAVSSLLDEIDATAKEMSGVNGLDSMAASLARSVGIGRDATEWLVANGPNDRNVAGAASVNFMMLLGYVCGGWVMGRSTLKAQQLLDAGQGDSSFLETKQMTARFYFEHLLPRAAMYLETVKAGPDSMMALDIDKF